MVPVTLWVCVAFESRWTALPDEPPTAPPLPMRLRGIRVYLDTRVRGEKISRPSRINQLYTVLDLVKEEPLIDLTSVAGDTQVILFEGAGATGRVTTPAGNGLQIGAARR